MSEGFERTRETSAAAAANARLLRRAAERAVANDKVRLRALAERYAEYAEALLDTIRGDRLEPDPDQAPLL